MTKRSATRVASVSTGPPAGRQVMERQREHRQVERSIGRVDGGGVDGPHLCTRIAAEVRRRQCRDRLGADVGHRDPRRGCSASSRRDNAPCPAPSSRIRGSAHVGDLVEHQAGVAIMVAEQLPGPIECRDHARLDRGVDVIAIEILRADRSAAAGPGMRAPGPPRGMAARETWKQNSQSPCTPAWTVADSSTVRTLTGIKEHRGRLLSLPLTRAPLVPAA